MNNLDRYVVPKFGAYKRLAQAIGISRPRMAEIRTGAVLPNVQTMRRMCVELSAKPLDLFPREEIDLIHCMGRKGDRHRRKKRFTFRVPEGMPEDFLQVMGYASWQGWMDRHLERDLKRYKKKRPAGGANANGAVGGLHGNESTSIVSEETEEVKCAD